MLIIEKISFGYTAENTLDDVSLVLGPNQKVGLVGVNGAGKSTLIKIIAGELAADFGVIRNTFSTGYIAQELGEKYKDLDVETIADFINYDQEYPFENHKIARLLAMIGMSDKTPESNFKILSGGQKAKTAIVKILLEEPELLLLDEPTNFLDIKASKWLMNYLNTYKGSILVISHDLELMNKALEKVWFLNEYTHKIEQFKGNYSDFLEQKELENKQLITKIKKQKKEYEKLLQISEHLKGMNSTKMKIKGAKYREHAIKAKENISKAAKKSKTIKINYNIQQTPGSKILTVKNVARSFKTETGLKQVLFNINFTVYRKNRVVIIGANGAGKSTLLKILNSKLEGEDGPEGKATVNIGINTDIGYYAQEYDNLNHDNTPLNEFPPAHQQRIRSFLGSFLITNDMVHQKISTLSGGEKTRLALAKIFYNGHNVLMLDEPTTFLDPASQDILKQALINYPETIIIVSHDEDLVEAIKPTHALLLPEEKFTIYDDSLLKIVGIS